MPHSKDFEYDGDSLDKLNSRFFRTALFAHLEEDDGRDEAWTIKIGSMPIYRAVKYSGLTVFSLVPDRADDAYCDDILDGQSITSIDDVLDFLKKKMSCA